MKEKIETMTIRPGREYAGIVKKIEDAAKTKKWSVNKFILEALSEKLKRLQIK